MKRQWTHVLLAGMLATGLTACDEDGLLGPGSTIPAAEEEILVDPDFSEVLVTDAEAALDAVSSASPVGLFGEPDPAAVDAARALLSQARDRFEEARDAWQDGDRDEARERADEGRRLVAEAWVRAFGEEAVERLLVRLEHAITWLEERVDGDVSTLLSRIEQLRDEAEDRYAQGDLVGAVERLLRARRLIKRERTHMRRDAIANHARLALFTARSAIDLAIEIVGDDPTDRQAHALRHAEHDLDHAQRAFENGRYRVAFGLAHDATGLALVAVMLEAGSDTDRVAMMIELSGRAIAAAEEALVGADPESFAIRLLEHAKNLQARAIEIAETHPRRAVYVLWQSSAMAYGIVLLVS